MRKIMVTEKTETLFPRAVVEAKMSVTPNQMDVLSILLAEIGQDSDMDENLVYVITAKDYAKLKGYSNPREAYTVLKDKVCGLSKPNSSFRFIGFDMWLGGNHFVQYNWFSEVDYNDGIVTLTLTPQVKQFLVEFKKHDTFKVFAKLQYILPMRSQYSKRIYLMCREYIMSGERWCDTDWKLFLEKLQIPSSYKLLHIKERVLEQAKKEINTMSDIEIDYEITDKAISGGRTPVSIKFFVKKKAKLIENIQDWE